MDKVQKHNSFDTSLQKLAQRLQHTRPPVALHSVCPSVYPSVRPSVRWNITRWRDMKTATNTHRRRNCMSIMCC